MPVRQLHRHGATKSSTLVIPSDTALKTSQEIENEQSMLEEERESQKLIRGLITAAIGCITYLRGLIPERSFYDMTYGSDPISPQAKSRINIAASAPSTVKRAADSTRIKGIRRGASEEADTLIEWIEHGIFQALDKGYLRAFQLAVFLDPKAPDVILEAYTFTLNYSLGKYGKRPVVDGMEMTSMSQNGYTQDLGQGLIDLQDIKRSVKAMIRRLIVVTQNLDSLPENRYLKIRLYHTDDTPAEWAPPKFTVSRSKPFEFMQNDYNGLRDEVFGIVNTGLHSAQVRVTSLKRQVSDFEREDGLEATREISNKRAKCDNGVIPNAEEFIEFIDQPATLKQSSLASRTKDICFDNQSKSIDVEIESALTAAICPKEPSQLHPGTSCHDEETESNHFVQNPEEGHSYPFSIASIKNSTYAENWSSSNGESHTNERLRKQDQSSETYPMNAEKILTEDLSSKDIVEWHHANHKMQLREQKSDELQRIRRNDVTAYEEVKYRKKDALIFCDCGSDIENLASIQCDICNHWQHCECYGFVDETDQRIGDMHICYTCLFGKNDIGSLEKMKQLAHARRVVRYLLKSKTPKTHHDIIKTLDLQQSLVSKNLDILIKTGFILVVNPRGVATKKTPDKYKLVQTEDNIKLIERQILDPLINIAQHYLVEDMEIEERSINIPQRKDCFMSAGCLKNREPFPQNSMEISSENEKYDPVTGQMNKKAKTPITIPNLHCNTNERLGVVRPESLGHDSSLSQASIPKFKASDTLSHINAGESWDNLNVIGKRDEGVRESL